MTTNTAINTMVSLGEIHISDLNDHKKRVEKRRVSHHKLGRFAEITRRFGYDVFQIEMVDGDNNSWVEHTQDATEAMARAMLFAIGY